MVKKRESEEKSNGPQADHRLIQDLKGSLKFTIHKTNTVNWLQGSGVNSLKILMDYCI